MVLIQAALPKQTPLPLENGDKLTLAEFERRYDATPQLKKAELIFGSVYRASALRANAHGKLYAHSMGGLTGVVYRGPGSSFCCITSCNRK